MAAYQWDARDYEMHSNAQQGWAQELIDKLHCQGNENILDVGCGDGRVTAELARYVSGGSVVGIDSSEAMIILARRHFPAQTHPNLKFMVMDAVRILFKQEFDIIFSNAALHWVRNHKPVMEGIYRALRPGGRILLQMGGKGNAERILSVLDVLLKAPAWQRYFRDFSFPYGFFNTEEYCGLLTTTGFAVKRVELIPKDMQHDGPDGLAGWIRTTWLPYTQRIPDAQREQFIRELTAAYLQEVPLDTAGRAHIAMMRLEVEAVKP